MSSSIRILDRYYAEKLGCAPEDIRGDALVVVAKPSNVQIRFAKGYPLALLAIGDKDGAAISVLPHLLDASQRSAARSEATGITDGLCEALQRDLEPLVPGSEWFRGWRLFCDEQSFIDQTTGDVRLITTQDPRAIQLHQTWGGDVYGQIVDGSVAAWAAIKPLSDIVWDLSIQTLPQHRGRGYAKSAVSAALKAIFASGKLAAWGTDQSNTASLRTAQAVGFQHYGQDFGCIAR